MNCPKCNGYQNSCVDSRIRNGRIKRRRVCSECGHRYNTVEIVMEELDRLYQKEAIMNSLLNYAAEVQNEMKEGEGKNETESYG